MFFVTLGLVWKQKGHAKWNQKKVNQKPSLDEIIKENPHVDEESELDYLEEEEKFDLISPLFPFEERFYDEEGNFYPDGFYDDKGNTIPNANKED